jgi:hypothetical protein
MERSKKLRLAGAVWGLLTVVVYGQYAEQTISLSEGWNAIYLQVQPDSNSCDVVFSDWPVSSVNLYNMERTAVQYVENPDEPLDVSPEFLVWVPGQPAGATVLNSVIAGHSYLIFATNEFTQVISGRPAVPRIEWIPGTNKVNLVGFAKKGTAKFGTYIKGAGFHFDSDPNLGISDVSGTSTNGYDIIPWFGLDMKDVLPGKAYFIACDKASLFSGPVKVSPAGTGGVIFSADSSHETLRLKNESGGVLNVTLSVTNSARSPAGIQPILPDLLYFDYQEGWKPFKLLFAENQLGLVVVEKQLQADEEWTVPLAIDRTSMVPTNLYGGVLVCSDDAGGEVKIALEAQYGEPDPTRALWPAGLWVGKARLDQVSQVLSDGTTLDGAAAGSPMELRLILHVDTNTTAICSLLQRVLISGSEDKEGNWTPELYVKESAVPDGQTSVRISSVAFGLNNDIEWDEHWGDFGDKLRFTYTIDANDPVNPFRHPFHPDHDGLDYDFETPLPSGDNPQNYIGAIKPETFSISNTVSLIWHTHSMTNGGSALWNPSESVSGDIQFKVDGVRTEGSILMQGDFELQRISQVGSLTK